MTTTTALISPTTSTRAAANGGSTNTDTSTTSMQRSTATQAAGAASMYEVTQSIARRLNLGGNPDLKDTLVSVLQAALSLLNAPFAEIMLINSETQKPYIVSSAEPEQLADSDRYDISMRYLPWITLHAEPLLIADAAVDRAELSPEDDPEAAWLRSFLGVPLMLGQKVIGGLAVASDEAGRFHAADLDLLGALCATAAVSINSSELYDQLNRRLRETEALATISHSLTYTLDMDEVLSLIVHAALDTIPSANKTVIHLLSRSGEELIPKALADRQNRTPNRARVPVRKGIAGLAVRERRTIYVPDTSADQRYVDLNTNPRSLMCAPLVINDRVIGSISMDSDEIGAFSQDDQRLLTAFAHSAALAINNARMYSELAQAYHEVEQNQQQILESGNTLAAVFDGVADDLYIVGRDYHLITVNRALADRRNVSTSDMIGQPCYQAIYDRVEPCQGCPLQTSLNTATQKAWTLRHGDGERRRENELRFYPIRDPQGPVGRAMVFAHDVTERRQIEAALFQAEKLSAVGRLAAGIAHEINNPMTVILSNGEMLKELLPPNEQASEHVDLILSAGKRASKIVRNLLDFSGRVQIEFSATDLHKTIEDTVSLLKHQFKRSSTTIESQLQAQPAMILGNRDQLQVVWMNLLVNALDALGERPEGRHIRVCSTQSEDGRIQVTVSDNGNGIPPETAKHLFEPFFTTKRPGVGTGLGLFNCYNIISQHGGDISVDSQLGAGTTFTINLPAYS